MRGQTIVLFKIRVCYIVPAVQVSPPEAKLICKPIQVFHVIARILPKSRRNFQEFPRKPIVVLHHVAQEVVKRAIESQLE